MKDCEHERHLRDARILPIFEVFHFLFYQKFVYIFIISSMSKRCLVIEGSSINLDLNSNNTLLTPKRDGCDLNAISLHSCQAFRN